ncbi:MAG: AAA domain-containing protein [Desulfobacteraceae bacterium]|nr:AAA family ATPase [Desulfobacteraceae bacterium]MBC2757993.1 AAA domain-containing protein [Desulfobacteraceae bacterium]
MKTINEKIPNPKEIEKEIGEFLSKKYGDQVKMISPIVMPHADHSETDDFSHKKINTINFDLKPEELIAYLDQYVIKQDLAKQILATKVCTHFNRIKYQKSAEDQDLNISGGIKNNVLMLGPTGVGKTYIIKLIANKLGIPFVKGDATKFSETGYVGGDVEDLVRDLVRESDNDIELAEYGIIYIDEIDKIASSGNLIGADVSRTGVQRALLKPMEETDVELKVPHDPISMIQEVEQFRKTGKREKRSINTKNILFIMSGAFGGLDDIIKKRTTTQGIGFGSHTKASQSNSDLIKQVKAEDLICYGFESEFVGRLPVKAVFERLEEEDLLKIMQTPNNPVLLNKKLDFATYGIDIKFSNDALVLLAKRAYEENTGARGLVSVIEQVLIPFETKLPSTNIKRFPVTVSVIENPERTLSTWLTGKNDDQRRETFNTIAGENKEFIINYLNDNRVNITNQYGLPLSAYRIDKISDYYCNNVTEVGSAVKKIKSFYDKIKKIELDFYSKHDINIVLEEDAIDTILEQLASGTVDIKGVYEKISADFEYGFKLIREKTHRNRFFLSKSALTNPENFLNQIIKTEFTKNDIQETYSLSQPEFKKNS